MPSLENLKNFSQDISQVGDELQIRQQKGSTLPEVQIPPNVPLEDDSYDFEFGLPEPEADYELDGESEGSDESSEGAMSADDIIASMTAGAQANTTPSEPIEEELDPETAALLGNLLPSQNEDQESTSIDEIPNLDSLIDPIESVSSSDNMEMIDDLQGLDFPETDPLDFSSPEMDLGSTESLQGFDDLDGLGDLDTGGLDNPLDLDSSFDSTPPIGVAQESAPTDSFDTLPNEDSVDSIDNPFDIGDDFSSTEQSFNLDDDFSSASVGDGDFALDLNSDFSDAMSDLGVDDASFSEDFGDSAFEIPGFSDAEASDSRSAPLGLLRKKETDADSERTHLTDTEYELFKTNLQSYPLNLRLAVDKVVINDEFTDIAIMEVLFKVVKKVSARKLATHLEKMLNITISVPLNYERRTVEQYEAYKLSLEYQLKNRIIPGSIAAIVLGAFLFILFYLGSTFVYRPIMAEILYNDGYTLIENDLYEQSEIKFNEAMSYQVKKRWFFEYARAYRDKNQFERARNMYNQLVLRFDYDKEGAMEYARMELEYLANYERAEEITNRYILDNYINDEDAMLLLGDIYLDWATSLPEGLEKADRFELARLQYATLIDLYGADDLYLSRMMRYFMRTDNLREVLPLQTYFLAEKEVNLEVQDLVELGGYLLEKRYGYLSPADEFLRGSIENLRGILDLAIEADPSIPEGHYNLAQYFVHTDNYSQAITALTNAMNTFELAPRKTHERTLKYVNAHRLLGEIYAFQEEYLLAEEVFGNGIRLFEDSQRMSGILGNSDVGKLYSNMADIDYFISGDLAVALENYLHSLENFNDTPSIRYKIGFIQYDSENYTEALNSFIKTADEDPSDRNLLLALGNVLSIRDDDSAAASHYERLLDRLNADRQRYGILFPQVRVDHAEIVDLYLKTTNNLGVTLARLADKTGNTALQSEALAHFSESLRAWDALTRNQETMIRLEGSNLAEQNIKYLLYPISEFDPAIYAPIPRTLFGEIGLTQSSLN